MVRVRVCICTFLVVLFFFFLQSYVEICEGVSTLDLDSVRSVALDLSEAKRVCSGKIGECSEEDEVMDSESSRRVLLMQRRYISYDTLKRDLVPCYRPGASYYNCRGPGVANFYNRGCEVITRCARGD